jgi:hypothetical protein
LEIIIECSHKLDSTQLIVTLLSLAVRFMRKDCTYWIAFAADVASYFVLLIDFHNDLWGFFHQASCAQWALVIVSLAAKFAEELTTFRVLALHWTVDNLLTDSAKKVLI